MMKLQCIGIFISNETVFNMKQNQNKTPVSKLKLRNWGFYLKQVTY